jgi:hypothetical protein
MSMLERTLRDKHAKRSEVRMKLLLAQYVSSISAEQLEASQVVDDLAFYDPTAFWTFIELAAESDFELERLKPIGWGPLTWLLRLHPDDFVERVAGGALRDPRIRWMVERIDQDRVAPDVWRRLQS